MGSESIVASTAPSGEPSGNPDILELFDLEDLQALQDRLADAIGVASIITRPDGTPVTRPSNFCRLCSEIIRTTDKGLAACARSDAIIGAPCATGPTVQTCLSGGLRDAGASIVVDGEHVANWLIGQVRTGDPDEARMRVFARGIGADPDEFMAAVAEVPLMSEEHFREIAGFLFAMAAQLSAKGTQNLRQARLLEDRERVIDSVSQSEARYERFLNSMSEGFAYCRLLLDDDGRPTDWLFLDVNDHIGAHGAKGKRVSEVWPEIEKTAPGLFEACCQVGTTGQAEEFDLEAYPGGWIHYSISSPEQYHFVVVGLDITARRNAERKIALQARQSELLAESGVALIGCRSEDEVFEVIRVHVAQLLPGAVVLVNGCSPDASEAIVRAVTGMDGSMLTRAVALAGFEIVGKHAAVGRADRHRFFARSLQEVPGGFAAYVAGELPSAVAKVAAKVFGFGDAWIVGITDGEATFGNITILTREPGVAVPAHAIEAFVHEVYMALERVQSEAALVRSHDLLAHLTEQVPGAVYQYRLYQDGSSCFPYTSPGMRGIFEVTPEEVREDATPVFGRVHPDDLDAVVSSIEDSARTLAPYHSEFRVILPQQGERWRSCDANPERMEDGSTLWHGVITDITGRKVAEAALRDSEQRYRSISEAVTSFVYSCVRKPGESYRIDWMAGAVEAVTGYTPAEIIERSCWKFMVLPEDRHLFEGNVTGLQPGQTATVEFRILAADGAVLWVRSSATAALIEAAPGSHWLVGSVEDITTRKRAENELFETNVRLEGLLKSVTATMGKVVETRDPYTQGHEQGVATLCRLIADEMGLPEDTVDGIETAALVHDIGKLSVPAEILTKPGRLSDNEFELIKQHSQAGHDILKDIDFGWPVADVVLQHHERMDGSGYPNGSSGEDISMAARVVALADVVEAMASHRPYRPALGLDRAVAEIREHPAKYDRLVSEAFMRLYESGRIDL
jgi:PAS domain S-box-containing protein